MFDDGAAASGVTNRRTPYDSLTGQIPKDTGRDRPYQAPLSCAWLVVELDQTRTTLLQFDAGPFGPGDEIRDKSPELGLVPDNSDDTLIEPRQARHDVGERGSRLQLASGFDLIHLVLAAQDLRRLRGARKRARDENIDAWQDLAKSTRGALHLPGAFGREWTQTVLTAGGRENLPILGDRVPDDEQFHEIGLRLLLDEGLYRRRHLEHGRVRSVVVDGADDQHLLVAHELLR